MPSKLTLLLLAALFACTPSSKQTLPPPIKESLHQAPQSIPETLPQSTPIAPAAPPSALVSVVAPDVLSALSENGFSLGALAVGSKESTTKALSQTSLRSIFDTLSQDVTETAKAQPPARVTSVDGYRLFDIKWLDSEEMRFVLVGVFNRIDRRVFLPGSCGEVRFLYRLSYQTTQGQEPMESRLPLMLNVVFLIESGDCAAVAKTWQAPQPIEGRELAEWLITKGPLTEQQQKSWKLKSIETDLQKFRIQSGAHTTLAGHIEYSMFVFRPTDDARTSFEPAPMENMPDVPRLKKDAKLKEELLTYLSEPSTLQEIDRGTLQLPERFLAKRATSFSPRGLSRTHNRPFRQLFSPKDFSGLDLSRTTSIKSEAALLRRLDGATCIGCHQSRAIAGFHFVGEDGAASLKGASLFSGMSPHLTSDLERRQAYIEKLAAGDEPDEHRPIPERQGAGQGFGAPCGLGDSGFSDWTCAEGLQCQKLEDDEIGECADQNMLSAPCEYGKILTQTKPQQDLVKQMVHPSCGASLSCDTNKQGFPLGACSGVCNPDIPGLACSDFVDIDTLQACLRKKGSYASCNEGAMLEVGVRACDQKNPCRQDYVCARTTSNPKQGACVPPYFVFPLRLDGYPIKL